MEQKRTVEILKALADETRLSIVKKLSSDHESLPSCDLVTTCASTQQLSQPAMSHHFSRLVEVGVIREEKRGTQKIYTLDNDLLATIGVDVTKL